MRLAIHFAAARLIGAVAILLCASFPAKASTIRRVGDDELVRQSLLIVDARIVRTTAQWNPARTQIHTIVDLEVIEFLKGDLPRARRTIRLRTLGGVVGDTGMAVIAAPEFRAGERSLLCLRPAFERLDFPVVGVNQGCLPATRDARTGRLTVPKRGMDYEALIAEFKKRVIEQAAQSSGSGK